MISFTMLSDLSDRIDHYFSDERGGLESLKIVNVVASGSIAKTIDLEVLSRTMNGLVLNKKQFHGAIYRMQDPKFVELIFPSGKIAITGFNSIEYAHIGLEKILNIMKENGVSCFDGPQVEISNIVCSYNLGNPCN